RVHDVFHLRIARIGQDAAASQSPRSPLESSLRRTYHLGIRKTIDHRVDQRVFVFEPVIGNVVLYQEIADLSLGVGASPISVLHGEAAGVSQQGVVGPEGSAQSAPTVSGRGLHIELFEGGFAQNT